MRLSGYAKTCIDWPVALRPGRLAGVPFRVYVVARKRNRSHVNALAEQADGRIEIWPLDEHPGGKFDLLDQLLRKRPPGPDEWVVVADDDIRFARGDLMRFVAIARAASFDLAQPSHDRRGNVNYGLTVSRPLTRARLTSFVECGPLFAVSPELRDRVTATFAGSGMGWGLEQVWHAFDPPIRLGVVDEVRVLHLEKTASAYDTAEALDEMAHNVARFGVSGPLQPQATYRTWFAWHRVHARGSGA